MGYPSIRTKIEVGNAGKQEAVRISDYNGKIAWETRFLSICIIDYRGASINIIHGRNSLLQAVSVDRARLRIFVRVSGARQDEFVYLSFDSPQTNSRFIDFHSSECYLDIFQAICPSSEDFDRVS